MLKKIFLSSIILSTLSCAQKKSYFTTPDYSKSENAKELSEFFYNYEKETGKNFFEGNPNFAGHYEINFAEKEGVRIGKMIDSSTGEVYSLPIQNTKCEKYSGKTPPLHSADKNIIQFESCNSEENAPFYYTYKWDETTKKFAIVSMAKEISFEKPKPVVLDFNPDTDMDKTLSMLDKTEDSEVEKIVEWIKLLENYDSDGKFSHDVEMVNEAIIWEAYPDNSSMTEEQAKETIKKFDIKYKYWDHLIFDGNDQPNIIKITPSYLGQLNNAYYFSITIIDVENPVRDGWSPQEGKIYKVNKLGNTYLITGIFKQELQ